MIDVVQELIGALGEDAVLTGDDVRSRSAGLWRRDAIAAKALLRPRSTEEVSTALRISCGWVRNCAIFSGRRKSATMLLPIRLVVVSCPALSRKIAL